MTNGRILTIDIETLPLEEAVEQTQTTTSERLKTALNGDFGRILCIGVADERSENQLPSARVIGWNHETEKFSLEEPQMLLEFWDLMRGFNPARDRIVGHNIFDFDLRFILKRSRRYGIKPTVDLSFARYRNQPIYDLMCEWECWAFGAKVSLDKLAQIFSLPTSKTEEINGAKVLEMFEQGRHREIRDYCLRDIRLTRAIYRRMTFADHANAEQKKTVMGGATAGLGLSR